MTVGASLRTLLRLVAAGVLGYAVIALLTTLGFVHWLDDADLYRGDWLLKSQGGLVALVSGLCGGAVAALIGGRRPWLHTLAVLPLLAVDTIYVLFFFARPDPAPLWFELVSSLGLFAATLAGGWLVAALRGKREGRVPSAEGAEAEG